MTDRALGPGCSRPTCTAIPRPVEGSVLSDLMVGRKYAKIRWTCTPGHSSYTEVDIALPPQADAEAPESLQEPVSLPGAGEAWPEMRKYEHRGAPWIEELRRVWNLGWPAAAIATWLGLASPSYVSGYVSNYRGKGKGEFSMRGRGSASASRVPMIGRRV